MNFFSISVGFSTLLVAFSSIFSRRKKEEKSIKDKPEELKPKPVRSPGTGRQTLLFDDLSLYPRRTSSAASPQPAMSSTGISSEFEVMNFFDRDIEAISAETDPRIEFDFLLGKVLNIAKEVLFAHTVVFAWANFDKHRMVIEAKSTNAANFTPNKRFPMESDLVSQIAASGKPQIVSRIEPTNERDLIAYYSEKEYVKSFVGAPVFFGQRLVGVLAADSKAEDAFGIETLSLLAHFTKLLSVLIKSYTDKYDLQLESRGFAAIARMHERLVAPVTPAVVAEMFIDEALSLTDAERVSVTLFDDDRQAWRVIRAKHRGSQTDAIENLEVDLNASVVGESIRTNTPRLVRDISAVQVIRYSKGEPPLPAGSFLVVPLTSLQRGYGAIALESTTPHGLNARDEHLFSRLAGVVANVLEVLVLSDVIREFVVVDDLTGTYNKRAFLERAKEEFLRAADQGVEFSVLLLAVDNMKELVDRYGAGGFDQILVNVSQIIRASGRPYDVVGRYDYNRLGIVLSGMSANDAYLWSEKLRKAVASHVISIGDKTFSVTISVGICGATVHATVDEILLNASQVLHKSMESGGNTVRVF
ncbi:MAG: sensor domain-containing diguanylate cyclase [Bacteroidota bacterium]